MKRADRKILIIYRESRLEGLIRRHNTREQARFFCQSRGDNFQRYEYEDRVQKTALSQLQETLSRLGKVQLMERSFLANYLFAPDDIVLTCGQDGLVANTLKYLNGQPLIAINPDPQTISGLLLPFTLGDTPSVIKQVFTGHYRQKTISMAALTLDDGQALLAINDFYLGPRLPVSLRYEIRYREQVEQQSSSGVIVSTGLGSTGWLQSLLTSAAGITGHAPTAPEMAWDARELIYSVREPFPSKNSQTGLIYGRIAADETLRLRATSEGGIIFSDGMVDDALEFASGSQAEIRLSARQGHLVSE